jgi:hypothetical protein
MTKEQVSVPLSEPLIAFVKQRAAEEARSVAAVVRRLVADAARQYGRHPRRQLFLILSTLLHD